MGKTYTTGYASYQGGVALNAEQPLDDRIVVDTLDDLYNVDTFYQRAYNGMVVAVMNTETTDSQDPTLWMLINNTPFTALASFDDIDNIKKCWIQIGGGGGSEYYWHDLNK